MFGKKIKDIVKIDSLIGLRAEINGNITGSGNYKIDGKIIGDIDVNGDVIVDKKAVINGNVTCANLIVGGTVMGNISCEGVTFRKSAYIEGNTVSKDTVIEEGAKIIGSCQMQTNKAIDTPKEEEDEL